MIDREQGIEVIQLVINDLVATANALRLYPSTHPSIASFYSRLNENMALAMQIFGELTLLILDKDLVVNGRLHKNGNAALDTFVNAITQRGIERISFLQGISNDEIKGFIEQLSSREQVVMQSSAHIILGKLLITNSSSSSYGQTGLSISQNDNDRDAPLQGEISKLSNRELLQISNLWQYHQDASRELENMYLGMAESTKSQVPRGRQFTLDFLNAFNESANPLKYLATIKTEDEYTFVHTVNVGILTMSLASYIGFSGEQLVDITYAALMHDVGKVAIPLEILNKRGRLDDGELLIMQSHPVRGAHFLAQQNNMPAITVIAALEHHIRFDGKGYPYLGSDLEKNKKPHLVSQMISVADVYDALRSRRPYREPMDHAKIVEILNNDKGSALNPNLVDAFIDMLSFHGQSPR